MSTKDLINAIASGDAQQIESTFETVMTEKISVALDAMRSSVAQNMFSEEVELDEEQLDELSKDTIKKYFYKAGDSIHKSRTRQNRAATMAYQGDDTATKFASDTIDSEQKNIDKRSAGRKVARKKYHAEEVEFTLEDYSVAELEDFMLSEDFEQLDELSKGTLGSYIKKSKSNIIMHGSTLGTDINKKVKDKSAATMQKRAKGINKAVDKLTEDEEVVEEGYDSSGAYEKHDPKHPAFMKNYTKFKAANPKGNIGDFVAHMKKQK